MIGRTLALAALLVTTTGAHGTPLHDAPKWYVATVNGSDAANEHYGPFRSIAAAQRFCADVPRPAYQCRVEPVLPSVEWRRKGAR